MTVPLINPATGLALQPQGDDLVDGAANRFPIIDGIPRICDAANYSESFGLQWNRFESTQLDRSREGLGLSRNRFFRETGWTAAHLDDLDILEVGSGAGRFSRVVLEHTKARLWSVDYSTAVDANRRNNGGMGNGRLRLFQASIYELPFPDGCFDKVFCLGVLQHTPDFEASIRALVAKAKSGGEIVVDFYPVRGWWTKVNAKYLLRPITKRMDRERLLRLIDRNINWLMAAHRKLTRWRLGALTRFLPVADLRYVIPEGLPADVAREWAVLDTFDMFSPAHDHPQRIGSVVQMFERSGASVTFADYIAVGNAHAAVVRAVRK